MNVSKGVVLGLGTAVLWTALSAAPPVALAGHWRLNRGLSDFPEEVGFGLATSNGNASAAARPSGGGGRGGRSRGGGGGASGGALSGGAFNASVRETEEDAKKIKELIADAKTPLPFVTIAQDEAAVTITDAWDHGRTFTVHPNGKAESEQLDSGPVDVVSRWTGNQLEIRLTIENYRRFRYTYSRASGGQLVIETRLEEGRSPTAGSAIRRVYDLE